MGLIDLIQDPLRRTPQRFDQAECDKIHKEALALRARIAIMMTQKLCPKP